MALLAVLLIAYVSVPLAGLLFFIAAFQMRDLRPKRAKVVIWSLIALLIGGVAITTLFDAIPIAPATLELVTLSIAGALAAVALAGTLSLLFPVPDKGLVVGLIGAGLICMTVGIFLMVEVANTNFGL